VVAQQAVDLIPEPSVQFNDEEHDDEENLDSFK